MPDQIREAMIAHARFGAPREACGLLAADDAGRLRMAYCLTNLDASPAEYTVDPSEHIKALYHAEGNGWHLAGVFHSHPAGRAVPSATDVARALEPEWLYVIVGMAEPDDPEVRAFRIVDGDVDEVALQPEKAAA
jgi:proteasome lid subunit RPN8/RPN11